MNSAPVAPDHPPPPPKEPGSVMGGCVLYALFFVVVMAFSAVRYGPLGLLVLFLAGFVYSIVHLGWNRTHTGILIGLLLTGGLFLLLWSICGGQHY